MIGLIRGWFQIYHLLYSTHDLFSWFGLALFKRILNCDARNYLIVEKEVVDFLLSHKISTVLSFRDNEFFNCWAVPIKISVCLDKMIVLKAEWACPVFYIIYACTKKRAILLLYGNIILFLWIEKCLNRNELILFHTDFSWYWVSMSYFYMHSNNQRNGIVVPIFHCLYVK